MNGNKDKQILIPVSPAELIDKITILEVRVQRITDPEKHKNTNHELTLLKEVFKKHVTITPELEKLIKKLKVISAKGWDIEDGKRECERNKDFGPKFIKFARAAFKNNDERAAVKKEINLLLKSEIIEEKSYKSY